MKHKIFWLLIIFSLHHHVSTTTVKSERENFYTPVLLPKGDECIRKAIELGFQDMGDITIHGKRVNYSMTALYYELTNGISDLIETTDRIHKFDISKACLLYTSPSPRDS